MRSFRCRRAPLPAVHLADTACTSGGTAARKL